MLIINSNCFSYNILLFPGAVSTLAFGQIQANWPKYGEALLGLLTLLQGAVLLISSNTDSMLVAYAAYIIFGMLYNVMLVMTKYVKAF